MFHSWQQFRVWIMYIWAPMAETYILACCAQTLHWIWASYIYLHTHTLPHDFTTAIEILTSARGNQYGFTLTRTDKLQVLKFSLPKSPNKAVFPPAHPAVLPLCHLCTSQHSLLPDLCSALPPEATASSTSVVEFHSGCFKALPQANWSVQN